jgi:inner membrane protein
MVSWWLLRRYWTPVREAPRRWLAAIALALLSHPLLDAHTIYGTQLWWPLPLRPTMWSTVFIIDPLFTVPLLVAASSAWLLRGRRAARWLLGTGLALSSAYLGWSWIAKSIVDQRVAQALADAGRADAAWFSVPTTFNTWVWRVVAVTPGEVMEAYVWIGDDATVQLQSHPREALARDAALRALPAVARLDHFASGFVDLRVEGGEAVLLDLRMGSHPYYFFRFAVAEGEAGGWRELPPRALPRPGFSWDRLVDQWRGR